MIRAIEILTERTSSQRSRDPQLCKLFYQLKYFTADVDMHASTFTDIPDSIEAKLLAYKCPNMSFWVAVRDPMRTSDPCQQLTASLSVHPRAARI